MIKGIIFDMGHTLLRFNGDWATVIQTGVEAMAAWYIKKRINIDGPALIEAFLKQRTAGYKIALESHMEVLARQSLDQALQEIGAPASAGSLVEPALKIYFGPEEAAWQNYPDTLDTVKLLKNQGYRLGLYSNATDDPFIQRMINRNGLRPWLSPTFSSAGWGWRKPKRELFDLIAKRWRLPLHEIVMVGDTLNIDILGAQNSAMPGILVTMDESSSNAGNRHIQPAAVAKSLSELPGIIAQL